MSNLHVVAPSDKPTSEIYSVTPAVAKRWLSRNVRNRPIRKATVDAYARDMKSGAWQVTGEAIKFDTNGALSDGQHRLTAVVQSGATVDMLVVRGIDPDAQKRMDSGIKRTASDGLGFMGIKNGPIVAAAARLALREPALGLGEAKITNPTNSEIEAFVEQNPSVTRAAEMACHFYPDFDAPPSVLAVCWMRFEDAAGPHAAVEFFESIANMSTDGPGDARLALIRRLSTARRNRESLPSSVYVALIFRAWNAWRKGQPVTKLQAETRGVASKIPVKVAS